jgi:hypothetical protein
MRKKRVVEDSEKLKGIHGGKHNLEEFTIYPDHAARVESPEYKKVHDDLVKKKNLPCLACGVTFKTLRDRKRNPFGAKQLETHHHVIEWSLANAIDANKFNQRVRPHLAIRHRDNPMYQREMTPVEVEAWVDHSPDNLWVLCDIHHRHKWLGIHAITFPIWGPQDILRPGFEKLAYEAMLNALLPNRAKARTNSRRAAHLPAGHRKGSDKRPSR